MGAAACDYCGDSIRQDAPALRLSCSRGCEEAFHTSCVMRYLRGKPAPKDIYDGGFQCPVGRGSSYGRPPCKGSVEYVDAVQPADPVDAWDDETPAPGSLGGTQRGGAGGGGQAFILPTARIFAPEVKGDPLGRKLLAAAPALGKAAKKNARRAQRREDERQGDGGQSPASGGCGGSGDDDDASSEGTLRLCQGGRFAARARPGSGGKPPGAGSSPVRVGPAVYGSAALMEDDPRLKGLGLDAEDDDGFGVSVPAGAADFADFADALPSSAGSALPFFTGDEIEEDVYNQEIAPGSRPPPVRPRVQVDPTWGRAGALGSAAAGAMPQPPGFGGSRGGRGAARREGRQKGPPARGASDYTEDPSSAGSGGGRGGRGIGPSRLGGRGAAAAASVAAAPRVAPPPAGSARLPISGARLAEVAAPAAPPNRAQALAAGQVPQQQPAEEVWQEEGVEALLLSQSSDARVAPRLSAAEQPLVAPLAPAGLPPPAEQLPSAGQAGLFAATTNGGQQGAAPAAGKAPPNALDALPAHLSAALANHQDPNAHDTLVKHFNQLAAGNPPLYLGHPPMSAAPPPPPGLAGLAPPPPFLGPLPLFPGAGAMPPPGLGHLLPPWPGTGSSGAGPFASAAGMLGGAPLQMPPPGMLLARPLVQAGQFIPASLPLVQQQQQQAGGGSAGPPPVAPPLLMRQGAPLAAPPQPAPARPSFPPGFAAPRGNGAQQVLVGQTASQGLAAGRAAEGPGAPSPGAGPPLDPRARPYVPPHQRAQQAAACQAATAKPAQPPVAHQPRFPPGSLPGGQHSGPPPSGPPPGAAAAPPAPPVIGGLVGMMARRGFPS